MYTVQINKNKWHNQIQKYVFGKNAPVSEYLIPYLWLTLFCVIISPLALLIKIIKY